MDWSDYQAGVKRTLNPDVKGPEIAVNAALGITDEGGEVAGAIKKWRYQGHSLDPEAIVEELGDVLYYVTLMADWLGYGLDEVAMVNAEKLRDRYGDKFEAEKSINR